MNDHLTDSEAKAGDIALVVVILFITSPWWLGFLVHLYVTYWS